MGLRKTLGRWLLGEVSPPPPDPLVAAVLGLMQEQQRTLDRMISVMEVQLKALEVTGEPEGRHGGDLWEAEEFERRAKETAEWTS